MWEEDAPVFMNLSMSADPVIENKSLMMPFDGGLFAKFADGMTQQAPTLPMPSIDNEAKQM